MTGRVARGVLAGGWILLLSGCPTLPDDGDGDVGTPGFGDPTVGAEAFETHGCFACHGDIGAAGFFGPDIRGVDFDRLDEYLRDAATTHVGGPFTYLTDQTLEDLVAFLRPEDEPEPAPLLCTSCHRVAMEPRRPVVDDLGRGVHVFSGNTVTDSDCTVCHEISRHQQGSVRLWANPTAPESVVELQGDPLRDPVEADKVTVVCRSCHPAQYYPVHRAGGDWQPACTACHNVHNPASANLALVGTLIHNFTLDEDRPVVFTSESGAHSFSDGLDANDGVCQVCHTETSYHREDGTGTPHLEGLQCTACHTHSTGFLPPRVGCIGCHSTPQRSRPPVVRADGTGGHHLTGGVLSDADCVKCHEMSQHQQGTVRLWLNPNDPTMPLPVTGDPDDLVPFCSNCHNAMTHPIIHETGTPWEPACTECHEVHDPANANLSLVTDVVRVQTLGEDRPVVFAARTGANSFNDGDPAQNDGICQVCHTETAYSLYDGTGTPHNEGTDCTSCHPHLQGFAPQNCIECHSSAQGGRARVVNADGSGGHHLTGTVLTNSDCVRCHEMTQHQRGTVRVWLDPNEPTMPLRVSGNPDDLVPFCSNCHDAMTHPTLHTTGTWWEPACTECHELHDPANANLSLVNDLVLNQTLGENKKVVYTSRSGSNSLGDGDTEKIDGICQVCHTSTAYHLHDGTGVPHNEGTTCTACHLHTAGFEGRDPQHHLLYGTVIPSRTDAPFGESGEMYVCLSCHEVDTRTGNNQIIVERDCQVCHQSD